jgi:magnesium chelatase family protein
MDEFPEFERRSLDALRQPLEDRVVHIARIQGSALFPADFILIAALNPYRGREAGQTNLMRAMQETYKQKISGPILDRIDLWVEVPHVSYETLQSARTDQDETADARMLVQTAREIQLQRFQARGIRTNGEMSTRDIEDCISLTPAVETLLSDCAKKLNLSPRSYHRLIKVARSIADLEGRPTIETTHVYEALSYRPPAE